MILFFVVYLLNGNLDKAISISFFIEFIKFCQYYLFEKIYEK